MSTSNCEVCVKKLFATVPQMLTRLAALKRENDFASPNAEIPQVGDCAKKRAPLAGRARRD
jgi:hypothetical protein